MTELSELIDVGAISVNLRIGKGPTKEHTLLHWAATRGQDQMVKMLLSRGADASSQVRF